MELIEYISYLVVALASLFFFYCISLFTIWAFKTVNRILDKIENRINTRPDDVLGKITNGFNGSKRRTLGKAGMMTALASCQKYHKDIGLGQELTDDQLVTLRHTSLFKDTANRYKEEGLSRWGGLAWFSARFTSMVLELIDGKDDVSPGVYDFGQKMIGVSLALGVSTQNLSLTKADLNAIQLAAGIACDWVDRNPMANANDIEQAIKEIEQAGLI